MCCTDIASLITDKTIHYIAAFIQRVDATMYPLNLHQKENARPGPHFQDVGMVPLGFGTTVLLGYELCSVVFGCCGDSTLCIVIFHITLLL